MENPALDDRLREPLDDEERALMDSETWDWDNPIEGIPADNTGLVFALRFTPAELETLTQHARAEGMSLYAFIKHAVVSSTNRMRIHLLPAVVACVTARATVAASSIGSRCFSNHGYANVSPPSIDRNAARSWVCAVAAQPLIGSGDGLPQRGRLTEQASCRFALLRDNDTALHTS